MGIVAELEANRAPDVLRAHRKSCPPLERRVQHGPEGGLAQLHSHTGIALSWAFSRRRLYRRWHSSQKMQRHIRERQGLGGAGEFRHRQIAQHAVAHPFPGNPAQLLHHRIDRRRSCRAIDAEHTGKSLTRQPKVRDRFTPESRGSRPWWERWIAATLPPPHSAHERGFSGYRTRAFEDESPPRSQ